MRLLSSLTAAALTGLVAGASQSADVYMFPPPSQSSHETPSIPKEVARHILLQRTSRQRYGSDLRDIPSSVDAETAVGHIAAFGKNPAPLFSSPETPDLSQLVVIFEGATAEHARQLRKELGEKAAFAVSDPPSATANNHLLGLFRSLGVASSPQCELASAINPFDADCWTGPSSVVKYDLQNSPETLDALFSNMKRLDKLVTNGDLEVLLLVLPEASRKSKLQHWSAAAAGADLRRRRDAEAVLSDQTFYKTDSSGKAKTAPKAPATTRIPQCFPSLNSCRNQTNSCSGHGECVDKYAGGGGGNSSSSAADSDSPARCFACVCKPSVVERDAGARTTGRRTVHWGGNMCQKEDISVQFWLLAGFTIVMVGVVTFTIGMLYSVGEEKLPGVIGAGVSRSK